MKGLAKFREKKCKTQTEMAELIGVSKSYYRKVEGGFKKPSYNFIKKFKAAFPGENIDIFFIEDAHE